MTWEYWFKQGDEYTPVEFSEDGTLKSVVVGVCLITDLEAMKNRAKKIWEVDDIYQPSEATVVWEGEKGSKE